MPGYNNDQFYGFSTAKRKGMSVDEHTVEAKRICITSACGDSEPRPPGCQQQQQQEQYSVAAWNLIPNNNNNNAIVLCATNEPMELQETEPSSAASAAAAAAAAAAAIDVKCTTSISDIAMCASSSASTAFAGGYTSDSPVRCYCRPSMDVIHGCHYYFSDYY